RILLNTWWAENFTVPPNISMFVKQVDLCIDMVNNGLGYAILPTKLISDFNDIHKLQLKDNNGQPILRKTWMLYQKESLKTKLVHSFVEFAKIQNYDVQ
ncbi:MAG: LysR substrate-binding domain-containing protein, partial [Selenomonadaceae bacterium]